MYIAMRMDEVQLLKEVVVIQTKYIKNIKNIYVVKELEDILLLGWLERSISNHFFCFTDSVPIPYKN